MKNNNNNVMFGAGSFKYEKNLIDEINDTCFILDTVGEISRDKNYRFINFSKETINPFDFVIRPAFLTNYDFDKGYIEVDFSDHCDYLVDLFEAIGNFKLLPEEKRVIDRTLITIYRPYKEYLINNKISYDNEKCPNFKDFYEKIKDNVVLERLALALETFVDTLFFKKTSFNINPGEKIVYQTNVFEKNVSSIMEIICYHNMWANSIKLGYEKNYLFFNCPSDVIPSFICNEIRKFRENNIFCFLRFPGKTDIYDFFKNRILMNSINNYYCFEISESDVDVLAKELYINEEEKQKIISSCCTIELPRLTNQRFVEGGDSFH